MRSLFCFIVLKMLKSFYRKVNVRTNFHGKHFHNSSCRFQDYSVQTTGPWEDKMKFWLRKYEDLFGITKLSEMHGRVLEAQKNIQDVQEKRRKVQEEIFVAQKKLQEMQEVLHKTSMGDNRYISVVTEVHGLLKEQKRLQETFSLYDQTEREQQTALAMAINNSQDHETTYREKNKYLSLITGVVGGLLGLIGSSISNWRHRKDIKLFARGIEGQVSVLQNSVDKLSSIVNSKENNISFRNDSKEIEELLLQIKTQHEVLIEEVKGLQNVLNNSVKYGHDPENGFYLDLQVKKMLNQMEENMNAKLKHQTFVNVGLFSGFLLVVSLILFVSGAVDPH